MVFPVWMSTIFILTMAFIVIVFRMRAAKKPTSSKAIIMPPLGMSTGFIMFLFPETHIPITYALVAFMTGLLFSYPLIRTSQLEIKNKQIYLKPSKAFVFILFGLLVIRIVLHEIVQQYISVMQTASVFFILAFGMIVTWRIVMFMKYRRLLANVKEEKSTAS